MATHKITYTAIVETEKAIAIDVVAECFDEMLRNLGITVTYRDTHLELP